jgi:hypothetical protein
MPGYLSNYTDMGADTMRDKYIMVSVWANSNNAAVAPSLNQFKIEFTS